MIIRKCMPSNDYTVIGLCPASPREGSGQVRLPDNGGDRKSSTERSTKGSAQ